MTDIDLSRLPKSLYQIRTDASRTDRCVLVVSRDPGSANALVPVIDRLLDDPAPPVVMFYVDGQAKDIFLKRFEPEERSCPDGSALHVMSDYPRLHVILTCASVSNSDLETYARVACPGVPVVAVEDNYFMSYAWFERLRESGIEFPERFCAIDDISAHKASQTFPELVDRIAITGQPAFDRFVGETTDAIDASMRMELGLEGESVVVFAATTKLLPLVQAMAPHLAAANRRTPFKFVFRRHPRDTVSEEDYRNALLGAGVDLLDTGRLTMDQVGCLADLVMTTWSTEALHAVCRGKPVIYVRDPSCMKVEGVNVINPPPVEAGAAMLVGAVAALESVLGEDFLPVMESDMASTMYADALDFYLMDGENAARVAVDVRDFFPSDPA